MRKLTNYWMLFAFAAMLISFGTYSAQAIADAGPAAVNVSASADIAIDVAGDPIGFFKSTYDAAKTGQWWMLVSLIVVGITWGARKYAPKISFFQGDRGGAMLAISIGVFGGMAHGILADGTPTLAMLTESIKVTVGAMGGYVAIKKSLFPSDKLPKAAVVSGA